MKDVQSWSVGTIANLMLSTMCMLPTVLTFLVVVGLFVAPSAMAVLAAAMGSSTDDVLYSGAQVFVIGLFGSAAASIPVSVASVLLHPVGAAAAGLAFRGGARRSGVVLMGAHAVTFLVGLAVGLCWIVFFSTMFMG